jgi:glycosyltransferase involved in cell wall biosynthesis
MIRFSIITVTLNAAQALKRTLHSVCQQTYQGIEYIVVDGASSDATLDLLNSFPRIAQIVSEPDNGLYHAMNKGLQLATGDYLWFINAGDVLPSNDTIARLAASLSTVNLPDIIYGETLFTDADGRILGARRLRTPEVLTWKSFRMGMLVSHQAFLVRRTLAPPFDLRYRFSSDIDWCIRCLRAAQHIHNARTVLSHYLDGGLSARHHCPSLLERFRIQSRYYGLLPTLFRHAYFACRFLFARARNYVPFLLAFLFLSAAPPQKNTPPPPHTSQKAEQILDKAAARYAHSGGVAMNFAVHTRSPAGEESFAGLLRIKDQRFTLSTPDLHIWYDGHNQWTYWPLNGEVMLSEPATEELQATNPALILRHRHHYTASLVSEALSPEGRPVYNIDLLPRKKPRPAEPSLISIQIEKATSLPARIVIRTSSDFLTTIRLQSFNAPLPPADTSFSFDPAFCPSAPIIDLR